MPLQADVSLGDKRRATRFLRIETKIDMRMQCRGIQVNIEGRRDEVAKRIERRRKDNAQKHRKSNKIHIGAHQFWCCLAPDAPEMKVMMENCPEALGILPAYLMSDKKWKNAVCALNVTKESFDSAVNITFDFGQICS